MPAVGSQTLGRSESLWSLGARPGGLGAARGMAPPTTVASESRLPRAPRRTRARRTHLASARAHVHALVEDQVEQEVEAALLPTKSL